jgi:hypothetical protein
MNVNPRSSVAVRLRFGGGRPGPDRRRWLIRPDDLVVLDVEPRNLRVVPGEGDRPARLEKAGPAQAYLIITLPPQHIGEIAYFATVDRYDIAKSANPGDPDAGRTADETPGAPPIQSVIAGWSRLVFLVADADLPITWTFEGVLEAMGRLELSVPANARPPAPRPPIWRGQVRMLVEAAAASRVLAGLGGGAAVVPGMAPGGGAAVALRADAAVIAAGRARRQLRVAARALGVSELTGLATENLHAAIIDAIVSGPIVPALVRPEPKAPAETQTALEIPYELFLSPNRFAGWCHVNAPGTSAATGHTELWHTRLGVRGADGRAVDGADERRTLRAVWTTAGMMPTTPAPGKPVVTPGHLVPDQSATVAPWYRMSLDGFDKHNVVHLSSNFRLQHPKYPKLFYEPRPLDVDGFALSSLGAWLDSRGVWDVLPLGLSVEEWRHRATLGRDHYVRVVYRGFLFPWGHRASVIKVTERQFHADRPGHPAYLRQRMFLVVREPVRTYRESGLAYRGPDAARQGEQFDLMLPFTTVRITTRVSPLLDPPEDDDIAGRAQGCFWPNVGRQPFKFHLVATDLDGRDIDLAMPLIFVGKEETDQPYASSIIPDLNADNVAKAYATATWPGTSDRRATVPALGQRVAFAPSAAPDDTTFSVQWLTFDGEVPEAKTYDGLDALEPRFFPVLRGAGIDVPSLQGLARTTQPAAVVYASAYLVDGFGGANGGQVFLAADPAAAPLEVKFSTQGDRSGGLVTPDLSLSGLSRLTGPLSGALASSVAGTFDPGVWFGALTGARLFGALRLADILHDVGFDQLDKLPRFEGQLLTQVERLIANLARLRERVATEPVPQTAAVATLLDQLVDPATGSIPALLTGGAVGTVASQLASLDTELRLLQAALPGSALSPGGRAVVAQAAAALGGEIGAMLGATQLLADFARGDALPQALQARLEWRPLVKPWGPFKPLGDRNLLLAVDAAGEAFTVTCSLDHFTLDLEFLELAFERVQFRVLAGKKPEVDVALTNFLFKGPLSFVQTLRELIPLDGFADPPDVQVTPEGITAGFSVGLPNVAVGVFSLENLGLAAGFAVPFVGPPMSVWFRFCERENPARLTVALFGGGFFIGLTANADGLAVVEGAIEFGAAASVDFGVAAGSVSVMAGLYFKIEGDDVTLAGYLRMRGVVKALGFVTVSIELYLEMRYESASGKCAGTATITLEVDVALFSVSVSISCTRKFAGSGGDPTLAELCDVASDATSADWNAYCEAFA